MSGGTIAILTHETGRYSEFWESLIALDKPAHVQVSILYGADIAQARNLAFKHAHGDWVWFLDDDQPWDDRFLLHKLLERDVDVLQPVVLRRKVPFAPVMTVWVDGVRVPASLPELQQTSGLLPVATLGGGGMLVRRRVWETMPAPWFRAGQVDVDKLAEDVDFTRRLADYGFQAYVDLDHAMDHSRTVRLRPKVIDGAWFTAVVVDDVEILIPASERAKTLAPEAERMATLNPA